MVLLVGDKKAKTDRRQKENIGYTDLKLENNPHCDTDWL
jgi:hypothetical protein